MPREDKDNDRFTPVKVKPEKSTSKRVALFIFMAAAALFSLVAFAIINADDAVSSGSAPDEIVEASKASSVVLPPPARPAEQETPRQTTPGEVLENTPSEAQPEVQQEQTVVTQPVQPVQPRTVRPAYFPALQQKAQNPLSDARRSKQQERMQAAASPTAIPAFTSQQGTAGAGNIIPDAAAIGGNNLAGAAGAAGAAGIGAAGGAPVDTLNLMQQQSQNAGLGGTGGNAAEANGWMRKEAFSRQALPAEYSQHTRVFQVSALELKAGSLLPCILISGLNSDLPGNLIAQVSENVWDTATGRHLLIPRGSRLIGSYDSQITFGQERALVIWSRLIFPDGSSLLLDNLKGADQSGYSGFKGRVNNHWGPLITSALMVSLLGAGVEIVTNNRNRNNNNNNNGNNNPSVGDILASRTATAIADAMTQILSRHLNRQPTITVKPGYRFMIFVQHDIIFPKTWDGAN